MNNLFIHSLQGLLLLFLDESNDIGNKNKEFYNTSIEKILRTINRMPHQHFTAGLQARDIYPEVRKYFYREHSNVTWDEFLTKKFALWIDRHTFEY